MLATAAWQQEHWGPTFWCCCGCGCACTVRGALKPGPVCSPSSLLISVGPRLAQYSLQKGLLLTQHHTLGHPLHSMHSVEATASPWHLVGSHEHEGVAVLRQDTPGQLVRLNTTPAN